MVNNKKIIIVPHCLLTKGFTVRCRNDMYEVLKVLLNAGTGIIQMPCPHLILLREEGCNNFPDKNYNDLSKSLSQKDLINLYSHSLSTFMMQVEEYKNQGFDFAGLVGIKGSPSCEVRDSSTINSCDQELFMKILVQELEEKGIYTNMVNINLPVINKKTRFRR